MLGALVSVGLMGEVVWGSVVGAAVEVDGCEPMVLAVEPIVAVETSVVVSFTVIVVTSAVLVVGKSLDTLVFWTVVWFGLSLMGVMLVSPVVVISEVDDGDGEEVGEDCAVELLSASAVVVVSVTMVDWTVV